MASSASARRGRSVTIDDVASVAGVSRATAARSLGGYGAVSDRAREQVHRAARTLGYRPNSLAKGLRSGTTKTIGVVIADITNVFFAQTTRGISDVAREAGYDLLLVNTDEDEGVESSEVGALLDKRVDGMIAAPASNRAVGHLQQAIDLGTPVVLLDRSPAGLGADVVTYDSRPGMEQAMQDLIARGHRRMSYITASRNSDELVTTTRQRTTVFCEQLDKAGIVSPERQIQFGAYGIELSERIVSELLHQREPPSALIASDSVIAMGALRSIQQAGLRIPQDISLVAVDDAPWMELVTPPVSVIELPAYAMGRIAGETLIARLGGATFPSCRVVLETKFLARGSIGPVTTTLRT